MEGKGVRAGGKAKRELTGAGEERREAKAKGGRGEGKEEGRRKKRAQGRPKGMDASSSSSKGTVTAEPMQAPPANPHTTPRQRASRQHEGGKGKRQKGGSG